jgi:hypothetical protein
VQTDFASAVDRDGVGGVVFERDDDTAYFYLLDLTRSGGSQIIAALNVTRAVRVGACVEVRWAKGRRMAGLFADDVLVAVYGDDGGALTGRLSIPADAEFFP